MAANPPTRQVKMRLVSKPKQEPFVADDRPDWHWRTPEGKRIIQELKSRNGDALLDDPVIGSQREED